MNPHTYVGPSFSSDVKCRHLGPTFRSGVSLALIFVVATTFGLLSQTRRPPADPPSTSFDVMEKSIEELQRALQAHEVTSRQLVDLYLARIEAYDKQGPALNAIAVVNPRAREEADALDAERASRGARGPLHGIPVVVKDNYETIEMPTSAGSTAPRTPPCNRGTRSTGPSCPNRT